MKTYLILGGNGFLGKQITKKLCENNKVIVADNYLEGIIDHKNVEGVYIDFVNTTDFSDYLEGVDTVVHLISTVIPSDKTENINKEIAENIFPTINLLESMVKNNTKKIIFMSSGGTVYGEHSKNPIKENEPTNPICNYGILKELVEKYLHLYNLYYGVDYKIIRLSNPYSDIVKRGKKQGIIPILIDQILKNETIKIWGGGDDVRDYIYINDAIEAIIKVMEYNGEEKVFNVGTGRGCSISQLIEIIRKELPNTDIKIDYVQSRKCDVENNILDISKTTTELGWTPTVDLETGIKRIIKLKKKENSGE